MADGYKEVAIDDMLAAHVVRTAEELLAEPTFYETGDDPGAYTDKGKELHKTVLFAVRYHTGLTEYLKNLDSASGGELSE